MRTLIIGCGYTGETLGERLVSMGHEVSGIKRDKENNGSLVKKGIKPINIDVTKASEMKIIPIN